MSTTKPGRNDPCPCGSGKKYKACHAAEDRAKAAPPPPPASSPLSEDLQGALALLSDPDVSKLSAALERLGALLADAGPVAGLRFEAKDFDAHVGKELARLAERANQDAAAARHELSVGTLRALGTRAFQEKLGAVLLTRASRASTPEERQALSVGALLATAAKKTGRVRPENNPVLDVVFDVQFREWCVRHAELARKYEALAGAMDDSHVEALVEQVQSDPALSERIAREAKERAARVEARLREPTTPSVFAPEEELWLTCVLWEPLRAMKSPPANPEGRREVVAALLRAVKGAVDDDFLQHLVDRLHAEAKNPAADEATRAAFSDAAIAFEAEPARMVLAALLTARQEARGRTAEELVALADLKALPAWTAESLEPYRALLETQGRPAAADRVRRAQEWLRAHPIRLDDSATP
ncbi:SEC-C domain-containing protein [Myxococcaceae bacterium JPH2]|nr:SEC-C domain-containing protein [Myxococcaceae bacterium JPH2]